MRSYISAVRLDPGSTPTQQDDQWRRWWERRTAAHRFSVRRIPFSGLDQWYFDDAGDLRHRSGRFFAIHGVDVRSDGPVPHWQQPIISQPEVGVLGVLMTMIDGTPHCLLQAKMEPGNHNLLQLSPTVQATRSNFTGVHGGSRVPYLENFTGATPDQIVVDALHSEQGVWFLHKQNRNMVVHLDEPVPERPDYRWFPLEQVRRLLHEDDLVNMDTRVVLGCLPVPEGDEPPAGDTSLRAALRRSVRPSRGMWGDGQVLSWLTGRRAEQQMTVRPIGLAAVAGWHRDEHAIQRPDGRYFKVIAVDVAASSREVGGWTQPLIEPTGRGLVVLFVKSFDGVAHVLLHARPEPGLRSHLELAPSVQADPAVHDGQPFRARYLDHALALDRRQILFDAVHSEEGGRFLHARNRYVIAYPGAEIGREVPDDYAWLTLHQLQNLTRHSGYLNVQARSILACLHSLLDGGTGQAGHDG
ncbi:NDP-hexose 2,3-dehydratase family protein [Micromonospora sp. PTRAS2]